MPKACAVPKCKSGTRQKCSVFRVPKNIEQFKKWQAAIPGVVLKQSQHVCEKHFAENCIIRHWIKRDANGALIAQSAYERPRLHESAVPTIFEDSETVQSTTRAHFHCKDEPTEYFILDTAQSSKICDVSIEDTTSMSVAKATTEETFSQGISKEKYSVPEDTVCPRAETNSPVDFSQQPDRPSLEKIHSDHDYVQQLVVIPPEDLMEKEIPSTNAILGQKNLRATEENMTTCSTVPPCSGNFGISNIQMNDGNIVVTSGSEGEPCMTISKFWGCKELLTERGRSIVFIHLESKRGNGAEIPVIERSITIDPDNRLRYCLCGQAVDLEKFKLATMLKETSLLPVILEKFQRMKSCSGIGAVNAQYLLVDSVFKDIFDRWHDNECMLLSKEKRCEECRKMRQRLLRREVRSRENPTTKRVLRASNPIDEKKLQILRKKSDRERRLKHRAKQRVQLLLRSLRGKADEIAAISAETLEEKCSALKDKVSEAQKAVLTEIISAASKKGPNNRRYTEEWIELCILMNIKSPGYYEFLRKNNVLPLPCQRTIRNYFSLLNTE